MTQERRTVPRRAFLKGAGATLALPFLESYSWAQGAKAGAKAPIRWGSILFANGVNPDHWWAKGAGDSFELSKTLQPLDDLRFKIEPRSPREYGTVRHTKEPGGQRAVRIWHDQGRQRVDDTVQLVGEYRHP